MRISISPGGGPWLQNISLIWVWFWINIEFLKFSGYYRTREFNIWVCTEKVIHICTRDGCIPQVGLCWLSWVLGKHLNCLCNFPCTHPQFTPLWEEPESFLRAIELQRGRKSLSKDWRCLLFQWSFHLFSFILYILPLVIYTSHIWVIIITFPRIRTQEFWSPASYL